MKRLSGRKYMVKNVNNGYTFHEDTSVFHKMSFVVLQPSSNWSDHMAALVG